MKDFLVTRQSLSYGEYAMLEKKGCLESKESR